MPVLLLALIALLSGCAAQTGAQFVMTGKHDLEAAQICCELLSTAHEVKLPLEKTTITVDKTAQVFNFGGNKAFFKLYALPEFTKPYSILITSQAAGNLSDVALFLPRVTIYDAQFEPTRYFDEKTLRNRGNNVERTIFVNPKNAKEKYIAIYGSDLSSSIERAYSMVTVTPIVSGPFIFNIYGGQDGKSTIRSSPIGSFDIEIQSP